MEFSIIFALLGSSSQKMGISVQGLYHFTDRKIEYLFPDWNSLNPRRPFNEPWSNCVFTSTLLPVVRGVTYPDYSAWGRRMEEALVDQAVPWLGSVIFSKWQPYGVAIIKCSTENEDKWLLSFTFLFHAWLGETCCWLCITVLFSVCQLRGLRSQVLPLIKFSVQIWLVHTHVDSHSSFSCLLLFD